MSLSLWSFPLVSTKIFSLDDVGTFLPAGSNHPINLSPSFTVQVTLFVFPGEGVMSVFERVTVATIKKKGKKKEGKVNKYFKTIHFA